MTEKNFQMAAKYGTVALALCAILNAWVVLRYREQYRDAVRSEQQLQQLVAQQQALQGLLQEFASRASSDPKLAEILTRNQIIKPTGAPAK
jgi:negative regulator of sigma E activity